jgi:hypothetical protein
MYRISLGHPTKGAPVAWGFGEELSTNSSLQEKPACYEMLHRASELKGSLEMPCTLTNHYAMKAYWGMDVYSTHSLTSALDGGEWSASHPGRSTPRERGPCTH